MPARLPVRPYEPVAHGVSVTPSRLLARRAAPRRLTAAAQAELVSRAAGIPFIAEALLDHWLETGDVSSLPPSVTRLVAARLDALSPDAETLLGTISILGPDAVPSAIEGVSGLDRRALVVAAARLDTAGIVRMTDGHFAAHALWTEATMTRMSGASRQLVHRFAAEWLERSAVEEGASERPDPRRHWALAMHWLEAGDPQRARRALGSAADVLASNGFAVEAAMMLERAAEVSGISRPALEYLDRAASLWSQELTHAGVQAVIRVHGRYDSIGRELDPSGFSPHHDVELLLKLARFRESRTLDVTVTGHYLTCAMSVTASPLHRLIAAHRMLFLYEQSDLDRPTADAVWRAINSFVPTDPLEACELELCGGFYHSSVAVDLDQARRFASRAAAIARDHEEWSVSTHLRILTQLSDCFERIGDVDAAFSLLRVTLDRGMRLRAPALVEAANASLIATSLEMGRHVDARTYLAEGPLPTNRWKALMQHDRGREIYWMTWALESGDVPLARSLLSDREDALESIDSMGRARILALHMHLALLEGRDAVATSIVPRLRACFDGRRYQFMDYPAHVLSLCLERFEGWDAAAAFVRRYVREWRYARWTPREEILRFLEPSDLLTMQPVPTHGELTPAR